MCKSYASTMPCGGSPMELPRFFPRQLVTPDDLTQEQEYFRHRLRLHNRMLWGWGTVCGSSVCRIPMEGGNGEQDPWKVMVEPGYLLGPYGDDIMITRPVIVDLRSSGVNGMSGEECVEPDEAAADPWCSRICLDREPGPRWIAVRYVQCLTRPVKVQPAGCGCTSEDCEYSRVRDGFEIGILDRCPESHQGDPPDLEEFFQGGILDCPECPDDPWVVLARVNAHENGIEGEPDNCSCRRLVISFGSFWWRCGERRRSPRPQDREINMEEMRIRRLDGAFAPAELSRGTSVRLTVLGRNFPEDATFSVPDGFEIEELEISNDQIRATLKVFDSAPAGPQRLRLVGADNQILDELEDAFIVEKRGGNGDDEGGDGE